MSDRNMLYRNPYGGYSDNEYGYNNNNNSSETPKGHNTHGSSNGYGHYNGGHSHFGQEDWSRTNGYTTSQAVERDVWQSDEVGGMRHHTSTYRVQNNSPLSAQSFTKPRLKGDKWPGSLDFLASSWAFSLSLHSLWSLPLAVIQNGGLVFILVYIFLSLILGGPLLMLEVFLGQYSGLSPLRLYSQLTPALAGLGVAVCIHSAVRAVLEMGVLMWAGQLMFRLFYSREDVTPDSKLFYQEVLSMRDDTDLTQVGHLDTQLVLVLGVVTLIVLVLMVAGAKSIGKVSMVCIPLAFMLMVTLVIRSCLAEGAPQGVLTYLTPNWSLLKEPSLWLETSCHVIFSLQLGIGSQSALARCNKYRHNLIRDTGVVLVTHVVWVLLAILLTLSLLGASDTAITPAPVTHTVTGDNIWLAAVTILDKSLLKLSYGWLWAGLYFILVTITGITSVYGYIEVISSSFSDIRPRFLKLKPLVTFLVLSLVFLMDLVLATRAGLHVYHLLYTYLATWPCLMIVLLTLLTATWSHGTRHVMRDLADLSKVTLPHWVTSHVSVIYTTVAPGLIIAGAAWSLYTLHLDHLEDPLTSFNMSLTELSWTKILGWSLYGLTVLPVVFGILVRLAWIRKGVPFLTHIRQSFNPTDEWYRNEQSHLIKSDRQSSSTA